MSPNCIERRLIRGLLLCLAVLLSACSANPPQQSLPAQVGTDVSGSALPKDLPQAYREALTLMQSGEFAAAVAPLEKLSQTHADWAGAHTNLGIAYARLGQNEAAITALERAVGANPGSAAAHNQLGILYRKSGRFDAARKAYTAALAADPDYRLAHRNLGILFDLYLQQPEQALHHYEACAALSADEDPELTLWIAELKRRIGAPQ